MALTNLQRLRLKIADKPRHIINETLGIGNGVLAAFRTQLWPLADDSDAIMMREGAVGRVQVRGQDYTVECDTGVIYFTTAPPEEAEVIAAYKWYVFTDVELVGLLTQYNNNVTRAAMEAIRWLLADTDRFIKYRFGQETVDRSASRQALWDLLNELRTKVGAPIGLVMADTAARDEAMAPFIEQSEALADALT